MYYVYVISKKVKLSLSDHLFIVHSKNETKRKNLHEVTTQFLKKNYHCINCFDVQFINSVRVRVAKNVIFNSHLMQ